MTCHLGARTRVCIPNAHGKAGSGDKHCKPIPKDREAAWSLPGSHWPARVANQWEKCVKKNRKSRKALDVNLWPPNIYSHTERKWVPMDTGHRQYQKQLSLGQPFVYIWVCIVVRLHPWESCLAYKGVQVSKGGREGIFLFCCGIPSSLLAPSDGQWWPQTIPSMIETSVSDLRF